MKIFEGEVSFNDPSCLHSRSEDILLGGKVSRLWYSIQCVQVTKIYMTSDHIGSHRITSDHRVCKINQYWSLPSLGSSIYYVINFKTIFNPPPLVIKRHQAPNPPPPNIISSVNILISISWFASNCCKIRYINECLPTERIELKQTVNNAIIYAN